MQIKKALNIATMYTEQSVWRHVSGKDQPGAQIYLLLDRKDHCMNLCEMKYSIEEFTINKKYAEELAQKKSVFIARTKTKKTIFLTMIITYGVVRNHIIKPLFKTK